jgi:hypothetical protein
LYRDRFGNIIEIVGRYSFSHPDNQPVVKKTLPPPQLIKFVTMQWGCLSQPVIASHYSCGGVRWLAVES